MGCGIVILHFTVSWSPGEKAWSGVWTPGSSLLPAPPHFVSSAYILASVNGRSLVPLPVMAAPVPWVPLMPVRGYATPAPDVTSRSIAWPETSGATRSVQASASLMQ